MARHDDLVTMDYDGRLRCPFHGVLAADSEYQAGVALCGCAFVAGRGGLLRARRAAASRTFAAETATPFAEDGRQVPGEAANITPQSCE